MALEVVGDEFFSILPRILYWENIFGILGDALNLCSAPEAGLGSCNGFSRFRRLVCGLAPCLWFGGATVDLICRESLLFFLEKAGVFAWLRRSFGCDFFFISILFHCCFLCDLFVMP